MNENFKIELNSEELDRLYKLISPVPTVYGYPLLKFFDLKIEAVKKTKPETILEDSANGRK